MCYLKYFNIGMPNMQNSNINIKGFFFIKVQEVSGLKYVHYQDCSLSS